jgi:redox-sensitive bicupin YhaK (pirin superfamily)
MSAGTGIFHTEFNRNTDEEVKFLQIWVYPNQLNVEPRYAQLTLNTADRHNRLQQVVSPNPDDAGIWIYQQAWFNLGQFDQGVSTDYVLKGENSGVYAFIINGDVEINGQVLSSRDGLGIWEIEKLTIKALTDAEFLLMEVPMTF